MNWFYLKNQERCRLDIYEDFYPALQIILKLSKIKQYLVFILNF